MSSEIERKLVEYRVKKAREQQINKIKSHIKSLMPSFTNKNIKLSKIKENFDEAGETTEEPLLEDYNNTDRNPDIFDNSSDIRNKSWTYYDVLYYLLCFILWIIVYAIFIEFQFGMVFLISSGIVFMFLNTRTGPKRPNEISAYSVFNKNCESIDGTLKAEQFEKEIRYGSGVVR